MLVFTSENDWNFERRDTFLLIIQHFSEQTGGLVLLVENFMETLSADW